MTACKNCTSGMETLQLAAASPADCGGKKILVANETLTYEHAFSLFCVAKPFRQGKAKRETSRTCGNESGYRSVPISYFILINPLLFRSSFI